jgi:hypothetical protein
MAIYKAVDPVVTDLEVLIIILQYKLSKFMYILLARSPAGIFFIENPIR